MKRRTALAASASACAAASAGALGAIASLAAGTAAAADWPSRPITLVVPFPAGGSSDAMGRLVAQRLGERLGQQVIVDNRAGAGGNLGTDLVVRAAPDGYTLAMSTSGPLANNRFLYRNMPFDAQKDLVPVIAVAEIPMVIAVNPRIGIRTLAAFLEAARARPGTLTLGNPGTGTIGHLTTEALKSQARVDVLPVPYKGDAPAITDAVGGTIDGVLMPVTALLPQLQAGRLKALAVTAQKRFPELPDVPTAAEQQLPIEATTWFAIVAPRGLPAPILERLNREVAAVLALPDTAPQMARLGASALGGTPRQLAQLMARDGARWQAVIAAAHIALE